MPDVKVSWDKSPSPVTAYEVVWTINGRQLPAYVIAPAVAADAGGYELLLSESDPGLSLGPKDVVSASVTAVGPGGSSLAAASVPAALTIPEPPPAPPVNVVLALLS